MSEEEEEVGNNDIETELRHIQGDKRLETDDVSEDYERTGEGSFNDDYASYEESKELTQGYGFRGRNKLRKSPVHEDYE